MDLSRFDQTTIEENWPKIVKPTPDDIHMLDCAIDVKDKDMPIEIEEVKKEVIRFFYTDHHPIYIQIIQHFEEMLEKDLVTDEEGNTLNKESEEVKKFEALEEVKMAKMDEGLFHYLYE